MDTQVLLSRLPSIGSPAGDVIFPGFSLGLASYLAVLETLWLASRNEAFAALYAFWTRMLAVGFAAGAAVSLAMVLPFAGGASAAPLQWLLAALAVQALLLGLMLSGWSRIGVGPHLAATLMMGLLTVGAAVRTLSADGRTLLSAFTCGALMVGAASAGRLLKDPEDAASCLSLKMAVGMLVIAGPLQLVAGDQPGRALLSLNPTRLSGAAALRPALATDLAIIGLGLWGAFLSWRGALSQNRPFLWACLFLGLAGLTSAVAAQAAAEAGRQPLAVVALYVIALLAAAAMGLRIAARGPAAAEAADMALPAGFGPSAARARPPAS